MFGIYKIASYFYLLISFSRKVTSLLVVSFLVSACGELAEINKKDDETIDFVDATDPIDATNPIEASDPINNEADPVGGITIYWDPMTVGGKNAETYRVLYSRPGERPHEVQSDINQATLSITSVSGYTVYIEAYNNDRNSVFELYNPQ